MKTWLEDQLQMLQAIDCENSLFDVIASYARQLGFDYCAYGMRMPLPLTQPKVIMHNNYPVEWQRRYKEKGYIAIDPTVLHGLRSLSPIVWSDELFAPTPEFWEDARSFGLKIGWAQSSRDVYGQSGILELARSSESISKAELKENELKMMWLAQSSHLGMSRNLTRKNQPQETKALLSAREAEVLRWTGDGKTSSEISEILSISERTVNFHLGNASVKLNTTNKAATVIRAAMLGMLY